MSHSPSRRPQAAAREAHPRRGTGTKSPREREAPRAATAAPPSRPWTEAASFVVHFERRAVAGSAESFEHRITAHKMEDGGISAQWIDGTLEPLVRWIAEHAGEPWAAGSGGEAAVGEAAEAEATVPAAAVPERAGIAMCIARFGVRAADGTAAAEGGDGPSSDQPEVQLAVGTAVDLEATIRIEGFAAAPADGTTPPCTVHFYGRNSLTQQGMLLGEVAAAPLAEGGATGADLWRARLRHLNLPAGSYRLATVATLDAMPSVRAHAGGPMLLVG